MSENATAEANAKTTIGYEIERINPDGGAIVSLQVDERHLNGHGIAHGGIVATLLDTAAGHTAATFFDQDRNISIVTVSMNISYLAPCTPGRVVCTGHVLGGGKTSVVCEAELRDETEKLLAKAVGVFRSIGAKKWNKPSTKDDG